MSGNKSDQERVKDLINAGAEISGSAAGATIGLIFAGPVGAVVGGAAGPALTRVISKVGSEIQRRLLGPREYVRVGATAGFAGAAIKRLLDEGYTLRSDDFFEPDISGHSKADEILEGVMLKARDAYEEKKLSYLGELYAQIAFSSGLSQHNANLLVRCAGELSYTQYVALAVAAENTGSGLLLRDQPYNVNEEGSISISSDTLGLLSEIYDLGQRGLVTDGSVWLGISYITPAKIHSDGVGNQLVRALNLKDIPQEDKATFYNLLQ